MSRVLYEPPEPHRHKVFIPRLDGDREIGTTTRNGTIGECDCGEIVVYLGNRGWVRANWWRRRKLRRGWAQE